MNPTDAQVEAAQARRPYQAFPAPQQWFPGLKDLRPVQHFARNVANVAYSARQIYLDKQDDFDQRHRANPPECGRRLRCLLFYFQSIIIHYCTRQATEVTKNTLLYNMAFKKANADVANLTADLIQAKTNKANNVAGADLEEARLTEGLTKAKRVQKASVREQTTAGDVPRAFTKTQVWRDKLALEMNELFWGMWPVPAAVDVAQTYAAPTESMHELLGQLYIWAELNDSNPLRRRLMDTPNHIRDLLRLSMCRQLNDDDDPNTIVGSLGPTAVGTQSTNLATDNNPAPIENSAHWVRGTMTLGVPACIFATRKRTGPGTTQAEANRTWLLGATTAAVPDTVKPQFEAFRIERLANTMNEVQCRLRDDDFRNHSAVANALSNAHLKANSQLLIDRYTSERRRAINNWMPFNHTDQECQSHFVLPAASRVNLRSDTNWGAVDPAHPQCQQRYFQPVPRCGKCRIIYDYGILACETAAPDVGNVNRVWMNEYFAPNPPLNCAEDIVHEKLRALYNGLPAPDIAGATDSGTVADPAVAFESFNNYQAP